MTEKKCFRITEGVGDLILKYGSEWTIFGMRYFIKISKKVNNIPGFAPTTYNVDCGELVMQYQDYDPYWLTFTNMPNLEIKDVEFILLLLKRGFEPEKHYSKEELRAILQKKKKEKRTAEGV